MVGANHLPGFGRFDFGSGDEVGFAIDGIARPIEELGFAARNFEALLPQWDQVVDRLEDATSRTLSDGRPLSEIYVSSPVAPRNLFQSGANYRTHVIQLRIAKGLEDDPDADVGALQDQAAQMMDHRAAHDQPYAFLGMTSTLVGPDEPLTLPPRGDQHDWELELGVVMRKRALYISTDEALDHVAGYTIVNDLTTRDLVFRPDLPTIGTDWLAGKNAPGFTPVGPLVVPARFVGNPQDLHITLRLNGEVMQDASTQDMLFPVSRLISHVSSVAEMLPGDLLLTGSPHGNGMHHGRFLRSGDVMESEITGLGVQVTRVA